MMTIYVYVTEVCQQTAHKYQLSPALDKLVADIEQEQAFWRLDTFPYPFWVKKRLGNRHSRLVCRVESHQINGEACDVLVCLNIFLRSDPQYYNLYRQMRDEGEKLYQQVIDTLALKTWLAQRCSEPNTMSLSRPSEAENAFLYAVRTTANYIEQGHLQDMVYESWSWVEQGLRQCNPKQMTHIAQQLTDCINQENSSPCQLATLEKGTLWCLPFKQHHVYMLSFEAQDDAQNRSQNTPYIAHQLIQQQANTQNSYHFQQYLARITRRIYAKTLLQNPQDWQAIQYNLMANLAFSPEEADILHTTLQQERPFPLFINGRAGSGKSTILQYLFSDYLQFAYQQFKDKHCAIYPVYFTCNQTLSDRAAETIGQILQDKLCHEDSVSLIKGVCLEFRGFLLSQLTKALQKQQFNRSNWLDYGRFRHLWQQKFGHQPQATSQYPASLCWHIMRCYIKGYSSDGFLEAQDYEELADEQRSIDAQLYDTIYNKVWLHWYQPLCKQKNYWDDQDLARYVLQENVITPQFAAIFCDEAQDLTRLEVQIILRLNLFSARTLYPTEIQRVPLVFAGDQFQTLNPTGFRWESIKAQVVEQFVFALDPAQHATLSDINYRELNYNFRSTPAIAQFSNIVHGLRAKLFSFKSLAPQQSWQPPINQRDVILVDTQNNTLSIQLAKQYDLVFILPCLDGQETSYIQQDPILQQYLQLGEDGSTSIPAMSVIRAKGLEFQRVVIYGFGADCPADLNLSASITLNAEQKIHHEYFLNRLYVAITRARRQLLVIDPPKHTHKFWQPFKQPWQEPLALHQLANAKTQWQQHLGSLRDATLGDITPDADQISFMIENAQKISQEGLDNHDIYLLRQAANLYQQLGDHQQQQYCLAEVLYIEEAYDKAGVIFETTQHIARALSSYWRAQTWFNINKLIQNNLWQASTPHDKLIHDTINLWFSKHTAISTYSSLMHKLSLQNEFSSNAHDKAAWHALLLEILSKLSLDQGGRQWKLLYEHISLLNQHDYFKSVISPSILAEVAYLAANMADACHWWERAKEQHKITPPFPRYAQAIAQSRPFPQNLDALVALQHHNAICEQFTAFTAVNTLHTHAWQLILDTLFAILNTNQLIALFNQKLPNLENINLLDMLIEHIKQQSDPPKTLLKWHARLQHLRAFRACTQGDWPSVLDNLNSIDAVETKDTTNTLLELTLYGLAHSEPYSNMTEEDHLNSHAQDIMNALKRLFQMQALKQHSKQQGTKKVPQTEVEFEMVSQWRTDINHAHLLGAVLERSQSFVDALKFYEALQQNSSEVTYAKQRWLVCKLRQAQYTQKLCRHYQEKYYVSTRQQEREAIARKLDETEERAQNYQAVAERQKSLLGLKPNDELASYPSLLAPERIIKTVLNIKEQAPKTPTPQIITQEFMPVTAPQTDTAPTPEALMMPTATTNKPMFAAPFALKPLANTLPLGTLALNNSTLQPTTNYTQLAKIAVIINPAPNNAATPSKTTPLVVTPSPQTPIKPTKSKTMVATTSNTKHLTPNSTPSPITPHEPTEFIAMPTTAPTKTEDLANAPAPQQNASASQYLPLNTKIPLVTTTRQPSTQLYLLDYRLLIVRSQGRLNIEHQPTGQMASVWPKTQRVQGDWPTQPQHGALQLQGTNLWLQFFENSPECVLSMPEHGISLRLNCA